MYRSRNQLADPALPYLAQALQGNTIRRCCQAGLIREPGARVSACRVQRLRYRRGERAIVQYELTLKRADGGTQTVWLAGYQYASRERLQAGIRRLERLAGNHPDDAGLAPGISIPALDMLLLRFPYDRRLPALAPFYFNIEQLVANRLAVLLGSDGWLLEALDAQPVRWRVGISAVARISIDVRHKASGETRRREFYCKLDATGSETRVNARLRSLESDLPFDLCPTLISIPGRGFSIQPAAEGQSLETKLLRDAATAEDAHALASMLARWHTAGESLQKPYTRTEFEATLERSVHLLAAASPAMEGRLTRLAADIRRLMLYRIQCPSHLDLKPEHIFFGSKRIALIDIELAADADPMLDIAILYARLQHGRELYDLPETAARVFARKMMHAYARQVPPSWWYNFPVCYAWALLKVAVHLFSCQRPGWPPLSERFVRLAEIALEQMNGRLSFLPQESLSLPVEGRSVASPGLLAGSGSRG